MMKLGILTVLSLTLFKDNNKAPSVSMTLPINVAIPPAPTTVPDCTTVCPCVNNNRPMAAKPPTLAGVIRPKNNVLI